MGLVGCTNSINHKPSIYSESFSVAYLLDKFLTMSQKEESKQHDLMSFIEVAKHEAKLRVYYFVIVAIKDSPVKLRRVIFYLSNKKINAKSHAVKKPELL